MPATAAADLRRFDPPTPDSGAALVEFALSLTLMCVILLGTIDFGRVFYTAMALTNAARAGAQYGAQSNAKSSDTSGMQTAAINSISLDVSSVSALAARACTCNGTAMGSCPPTGSCGGTVRIYVTVTAKKTFTTLTSFPGFPHTVTLTRAASMRAE
jgi:Flp pilus assembly protein TadG